MPFQFPPEFHKAQARHDNEMPDETPLGEQIDGGDEVDFGDMNQTITGNECR